MTALRALEPDLVLAQEVFEGVDGGPAAGLSTADALRDALGLAMIFHPIRRKPREVEGLWGDSYSGLATLSRWPIRDVTWRALPDDPDDGDRAVLFCAVETPGGPLRTANTHLTHLRHRDDLRLEQARRITADPWWNRAAAAHIFAGDLNARPEHPVHDALRAADFVDVFAAASLHAPPTIQREAPGGLIESRLDYVYLRHGRRSQLEDGQPPVAVASARIALNEPIGGTLPSDHFAVVADLTFTPGS